MTTIEEIHNEWLTAAETLVAGCSDESLSRLEEKNLRLKALGFKNTKDVENRDKELVAKTTREIIDKYSLTHPNNKVIHHAQVWQLCKKYNLFLANLSDFIGFVPEKNLQEIEKFFHKDYHTYVIYDDNRSNSSWRSLLNNEVYYTEQAANLVAETAKKKRLDEIQEFYNHKNRDYYNAPSNPNYRVERKTTYKIAAPEDEIDMAGKTTLGIEVVNAPKDPVVLFPIENDCYLIVTAWGDEASDPIVVNHKNN